MKKNDKYVLPLYSENTLHTYTGKLRSIDYLYESDCYALLMDNNARYSIPDEMPVLTYTLEEFMSAGQQYTVTAAPEKNFDDCCVLFSIEDSNGIILSSDTSSSFYHSERASLREAYALICAVSLSIYLSLFPFERLPAKKFKGSGKKLIKFCRATIITACMFVVCFIGLCVLCPRNFPLYSEKSTYTVSGECSDVWITSRQLARSGKAYNASISLSGGEVFVISSDAPVLRQHSESELKTILSENTITVTAAKRLDLSGNVTVMGIENKYGEIISVRESHSSNLTARICFWIIYSLSLVFCALWLYFQHRREFKK